MEIYAYLLDVNSPHGILEDVYSVFEISHERYPEEPHSWGQSRGYVNEASARLILMRIGNLEIRREYVAHFIGQNEITILETTAAERFLEDLRSAA